MLLELKTRIPSMLSSVKLFAEKYQITRLVEDVKMAAVTHVGKIYNAVTKYDIQISPLSILFRNSIIQAQQTVQGLIDVIVKFLREKTFILPGSHELTTIPIVLKHLTSIMAGVLEMVLENINTNMQLYYNDFVEMIMNVNLSMPVGDALASSQFVVEVKKAITTIFEKMVDFMKNMESIDIMLVNLGETLKYVADKTQEFVDLIQSDYLDVVLADFNIQYVEFITALRDVVDQFAALTMEDVYNACGFVIDMLELMTEQFKTFLHRSLQQTPMEVQNYMTIRNGTLQIDLPFSFQQ